MSVKGLWMFLWLPNRLPENGIPSWRRRVQQLILRTPSSAPWTNGAYLPIWTYQKIKSRPRLPGWAANRGRRISSFFEWWGVRVMCVSKSLQIRGICISGSLFYEPQFLKRPKIILSFLQHRCFNTKTPHRNVGFLPVFFQYKLVEVTGFEPAASSSRTKRSTKLSHTSIQSLVLFYYNKSTYLCQVKNIKIEAE